jgi:hypothetical protein
VIAFEYQTVALKIKTKGLAMTRKDVVSGLEDEAVAVMQHLGADGWELVSTIPFSSGANALFSTAMRTDCALAFFKRQVNR